MEKLVPGQTYFIVVFNDEDLKVPVVQTLVYVEDGRRSDGSEYHLFRELSAQLSSGLPILGKDATAVMLIGEHMKEIDKIKAELARVGAKIAATTPEARRGQVDAIWKTVRAKGALPSGEDLSMAEQYVNGHLTFDAFAHWLYNRFHASF